MLSNDKRLKTRLLCPPPLRAGPNFRKTSDTPARVSVVDMISAMTGKNANHSAEAMRDLGNRYLEVNVGIVHLKFPGKPRRLHLAQIWGLLRRSLFLVPFHSVAVSATALAAAGVSRALSFALSFLLQSKKGGSGKAAF